jgi:Rrf2 family nitric oxide-sensitive transcriptional repressor
MITRTTENAVQILLYLALKPHGQIISHTELAKHLDASSTYLSKVLIQLVRAGILKSIRGAGGGVILNYSSEDINLLQIIEACQGLFPQAYCNTPLTPDVHLCGFHKAMLDVRTKTMQAFESWTLADLQKCPAGSISSIANPQCHMHFINKSID